MYRVLSTTFLTIPFLSTTAHAACIGAVGIVCSGLTEGGLTDNSDGVNITIEAGAILNNDDGDTIRARGNNVVVLNNGTLSGDSDGVDSNTDATSGLFVTNNGLISVDGRGVNADDRDDVTVVNNGIIAALSNDGIRLGNGENASLTNAFGAEIQSGDEGFEAGDNATVLNDGLILADEDAVQVAENADITNNGIIESFGAEGDGLDIDSGTVVNNGVINGTNGAGIDFDASSVAISKVTNTGAIAGLAGIFVEDGSGDNGTATPNTMTQIVENAGVIAGADGTAIYLAAGDDVVDLMDGSVIDGLTDLGDDADLLKFSDAIYMTGSFEDLFDGGAGFDTVEFAFDTASLIGVDVDNSILTLAMTGQGPLDGLQLTNFEQFTFAGTTFTTSELLAQFPAPVPLPASVLMLLAAMGGLFGLKRRAA